MFKSQSPIVNVDYMRHLSVFNIVIAFKLVTYVTFIITFQFIKYSIILINDSIIDYIYIFYKNRSLFKKNHLMNSLFNIFHLNNIVTPISL